MVAIKGHFDGKVIVPEEQLDLPIGQSIIMYLDVTERPEAGPVEPGSSLRWMAEHALSDPSLPTDLSVNLDYYLYGTPKRKP